LQNVFGLLGFHVKGVSHLFDAPRSFLVPPEEQEGFQVRDAVDLIQDEAINLIFGILLGHRKEQEPS
jgi:hypothetical protein